MQIVSPLVLLGLSCLASSLYTFSQGRDHGVQAALNQQWMAPSHSAKPSLDPVGISYVHNVLDNMQSNFFTLWLGTWPDAIDWTAAVMQTHVSSTLTSISLAFNYTANEPLNPFQQTVENEITRLFSQITAYYFGQDAFAIRQQAHDDMLWVVLGWLEATRFVDIHSRLHHGRRNSTGCDDSAWHGNQFVPTLAHRTHVFYDIVHRAWDQDLCGGGLTWNPQLEPYKNTVTNTQFISAAVQMYMYHPGDSNRSPFVTEEYSPYPSSMSQQLDDEAYWGLEPIRPHDPRLLQRAIQAYDWLQAVELRNAAGLFVDGYHVSAASRRNHTSTPKQCDVRNEMVYTYNQGIILSGLRSLWEATGNVTYLVHGHELVRSVINATGWSIRVDSDESSGAEAVSRVDVLAAFELDHSMGLSREWHGLGHAGILEEFCDAAGSCSQDAQTFKGVFFHHFTHFCAPLPTDTSDLSFVPDVSHVASRPTAKLHANSCRQYAPWVARNARAALGTRDHRGIMGGWWGVHIQNKSDSGIASQCLPRDATDVWNNGIPFNDVWRQKRRRLGRSGSRPEWVPTWKDWARDPVMQRKQERPAKEEKSKKPLDPNDRGRGRTVESHSSGLAVVKCMWELLRLFD